MVSVQQRPVEIILRKGNKKFPGKTKAKTMRGWIQGQINSSLKKQDTETSFILEGVMNAYDHFHPETTLGIEIDSWKGKSSFRIIDKIDSIIVVKYQRPIKDEEPKEIQTEIQKSEMVSLINAIKFLNKGKPIETSALAMVFSRYENLGHSHWDYGDKPFFSDRYCHNKYTLALGVLDKLGMIKYSGGKIIVLNFKITLQETIERYLDKY